MNLIIDLRFVRIETFEIQIVTNSNVGTENVKFLNFEFKSWAHMPSESKKRN